MVTPSWTMQCWLPLLLYNILSKFLLNGLQWKEILTFSFHLRLYKHRTKEGEYMYPEIFSIKLVNKLNFWSNYCHLFPNYSMFMTLLEENERPNCVVDYVPHTNILKDMAAQVFNLVFSNNFRILFVP